MSNVLPTEDKKAVWKLYRMNFVFAGALVALASALLCAALLAPSFFALLLSGVHADVKKGERDNTNRTMLIQTQALLGAVASFSLSTSTPSRQIEVALSVKPSGIVVHHITYTSADEATLIVSGTATSNTDIKAYQDALRTLLPLAKISVPVSALAGADNGEFAITITSK